MRKRALCLCNVAAVDGEALRDRRAMGSLADVVFGIGKAAALVRAEGVDGLAREVVVLEEGVDRHRHRAAIVVLIAFNTYLNDFCLNSGFPAVFERSEMPLFSCWLCTWLCVWLCIFELAKTKHAVWLCIWLCILLSFFMRLEYARLLFNGCIFRFRYY